MKTGLIRENLLHSQNLKSHGYSILTTVSKLNTFFRFLCQAFTLFYSVKLFDRVCDARYTVHHSHKLYNAAQYETNHYIKLQHVKKRLRSHFAI